MAAVFVGLHQSALECEAFLVELTLLTLVCCCLTLRSHFLVARVTEEVLSGLRDEPVVARLVSVSDPKPTPVQIAFSVVSSQTCYLSQCPRVWLVSMRNATLHTLYQQSTKGAISLVDTMKLSVGTHAPRGH